MTTVTFDVKSNGQLIVTADDIVKSKGKATAEVSYETILSVGGSRFSTTKAAIAQTWCSITGQYDGEMIEVTGTFDAATIKSDVAKGQTDGSHKFSGSVRVISG
jgi:hypothetical protein